MFLEYRFIVVVFARTRYIRSISTFTNKCFFIVYLKIIVCRCIYTENSISVMDPNQLVAAQPVAQPDLNNAAVIEAARQIVAKQQAAAAVAPVRQPVYYNYQPSVAAAAAAQQQPGTNAAANYVKLNEVAALVQNNQLLTDADKIALKGDLEKLQGEFVEKAQKTLRDRVCGSCFSRNTLILVAIGIGILVFLGFFVFYMWRRGRNRPSPTPTPTPKPSPAPAPTPVTGSSTTTTTSNTSASNVFAPTVNNGSSTTDDQEQNLRRQLGLS